MAVGEWADLLSGLPVDGGLAATVATGQVW
jgi:hypothetical protein